MAQIPPIDDAYIDGIIKAIDPYDPSLNKTQGVKLRELIKLMRDRVEQGDAGVVHTTGDESITGTKTFTLIKAEELSVNNLADPALNTVISPVSGVQTKLLNLTEGLAGVQVSAGTLSGSRFQTLQDKDGVIALTSDIAAGLDLKINTSEKGAVNGVATLGTDGKIPNGQLPAIALTDTYPVSSEAEMLVLPAKMGDVAIRSDIHKSFILQQSPASALGNWLELQSPSVANTDQVPEGSANLYYTDARVNAVVDPKLATGQTIGANTTGNAATASYATLWGGATWDGVNSAPESYILSNHGMGNIGFSDSNQIRNWLGIQLGGETLQSVTTGEGNNQTTHAIQVTGFDNVDFEKPSVFLSMSPDGGGWSGGMTIFNQEHEPAIINFSGGQLQAQMDYTHATGAVTYLRQRLEDESSSGTIISSRLQVSPGILSSDAITVGQLTTLMPDIGLSYFLARNSDNIYASPTGMGEAYNLNLTPILYDIVPGQLVIFKPHVVNIGASTLTINEDIGSTPYPIVWEEGLPVDTGDLQTNKYYLLIYGEDADHNGQWVITGAKPGGSTPQSLQSVTSGEGNNSTSNALQVTGADGLDLSKDGLVIVKLPGLGSIIGDFHGGAPLGGLSLGTDAVALTWNQEAGNSFLLQTQTPSISGAVLDSRIKIEDAILDDEAVTLGQMNEALTLVQFNTNVILFTKDSVSGTMTAPVTGNITSNVTNAVLGVTVLIIHNGATEPTFDSKFKKLSDSGSYAINVNNFIYCQFIDANTILYSIKQIVSSTSSKSIEVTFSNPIVNGTTTTANLKYNKLGVLSMDWDDGSLTSLNAAALFNALFINDGTGRQINWRAGVAVIGRSSYHNAELGDNSGANVTYDNMIELLTYGWEISNHGLYSTLSTTDPFNSGGDAALDLSNNDILIQSKTGYKMKTTTVPVPEIGYVQASNTLNNYAVSSQRDDVGQGMPSLPAAEWMPLYDLATADSSFKYFLRFFVDGADWGNSNLVTKLGQLVSDSNSTVHKIMRIGTNNSDSDEFETFITTANTQMDGKIWVCSMRELMEYIILRDTISINTVITGNKMTITIDYSSIPSDLLFKDLTLICNDGSNTITNITSNGFDDVTSNSSTGLINIYGGYPSGDNNLLAGCSYTDLPLDKWVENPAHVYAQTTNDEFQLLPFQMLGDGVMIYPYKGQTGLTPSMYLRHADGNVVSYWADNGRLKVFTDNTETDTGVDCVVDTYYGLNKVDDEIQLVSTLDGITYTTVYNFGSRRDFNELATWYDVTSDKMYYLQGKGITSV